MVYFNTCSSASVSPSHLNNTCFCLPGCMLFIIHLSHRDSSQIMHNESIQSTKRGLNCLRILSVWNHQKGLNHSISVSMTHSAIQKLNKALLTVSCTQQYYRPQFQMVYPRKFSIDFVQCSPVIHPENPS